MNRLLLNPLDFVKIVDKAKEFFPEHEVLACSSVKSGEFVFEVVY